MKKTINRFDKEKYIDELIKKEFQKDIFISDKVNKVFEEFINVEITKDKL